MDANQHARLPKQFRHGALRGTFADATERGNFGTLPIPGAPIPGDGILNETDLGSLYRQADTGAYYVLVGIDPVDLEALGGGGSADLGDVTFTGNRAVDLREATGSATTVVAAVGAIGASDVAIAAAGADYTLDLAIAANSTVDLWVRATIVNTTDTHKRRIRYRVLVARDAGAPTIEELTEIKTNDTAASIYVADVSPVALYGALSISGNNIRFTVTAHPTKNQKVTVGLFPFVVPDPV